MSSLALFLCLNSRKRNNVQLILVLVQYDRLRAIPYHLDAIS